MNVNKRTVPEVVSHAEWETLVNDGIEARKQGDDACWELGDLAVKVVVSYGAGDLQKYATSIEVEYGTLRNRRRVAAAFENARRRADLTFSHHEAVAALEPPDADRLLQQAHENRWSVELLKEAILPATTETPALPLGKYNVILADPPWRYEFNASASRVIEKHYPTMDIDAICALPVSKIASDDAILFLWAPATHRPASLRVLEAWGFEYRTGMVWDKESIGMGHFVRQQHEEVAIARRGIFPCPEPAARPPSVFKHKRQAHSQKPDILHEIIEAMYPQGKRIELFARRRRAGWTAWGNEIGAATGGAA